MNVLHHGDTEAANYLHHLNTFYHENPLLSRSKGIQYIIYTFPSNTRHLPFKKNSNSMARCDECKRVEGCARREAASATLVAATSSSSDTRASSPSAAPSPSITKGHDLSDHTPSDLTSIYQIPPAPIPSKAWAIHCFAGRRHDLTPAMKITDLIRTFAAIPTAQWPLGLHNNQGLFSPHGDAIFQTPHEDNVCAEVFISAILPVIPPGRIEKFASTTL
ncbi:hypothetical protein V8D89_002320 [Ganoderma adspersum]